MLCRGCAGLHKSIKQLVQGKAAPDLGALQDVADFVTRSGYGSESEGEDAEASRVMLAQGLGRGNVAARQSRIRLHEVRTLSAGGEAGGAKLFWAWGFEW